MAILIQKHLGNPREVMSGPTPTGTLRSSTLNRGRQRSRSSFMSSQNGTLRRSRSSSTIGGGGTRTTRSRYLKALQYGIWGNL